MKKKRCIAMILAGGQGTRLYALTSKIAKPAVTFGSKYRIIDYTLSNCTNSNIDTVGVLTQYQPMMITSYIGSGEPWDLDRMNGGVHILQPYWAKTGGHWYNGTADAIFQNLQFIEQYDCDNVIVLSGDHIYKMDYNKMVEYHESKGADCTIAVIDVPTDEASRFGIMDYAEDGSIIGFEEKPKEPKSNHASMGIYVFSKKALVEQLILDSQDKNSNKDFGKNIIPNMLSNNYAMYAYQFKGYWKDVGTLASLWEANMDFLDTDKCEAFYSTGAKVYSNNSPLPPSYIGENGEVNGCMLTAGCEIYGNVSHSVISEGVVVGEGSSITNSVLLNNVVIGKNVTINYAIIDENVVLEDNAVIGDSYSNKDNIALVGRNTVVLAGQHVKSGEIVEAD